MTLSADRKTLVSCIGRLSDGLETWIAELSEVDWDGSQGFVPIVRRSSIERQFKSLALMARLVKEEHGDTAVSLLRPSCEELLWLRYFEGLSDASANDLVNCLLESGIRKDLVAQAGEVDDDVMHQLGLADIHKHYEGRAEITKSEFRRVGEILGWPRRTIKAGGCISTWQLAKETGSEDLYRFLYHATSRYVHFSPVELCRRGWGEPGKLHISGTFYEPYWAVFCLQWGIRLFGYSLNAVLESFAAEGLSEPPHDLIQSVFSDACEISMIPLITPHELKWSAQ